MWSPHRILVMKGKWELYGEKNQVMEATLSNGKTADSFSGHNIISIGFLPRMHGLSLVRRRYRTDPRWATLQNERPVLFPRKVLNKRGKLKELVQIKESVET